MREVLDLAREEYDFVILDSPPVLPVTDAVVLAREGDGVVLVVKGHDTPRELVRRARDQLALAGAHLLGAVVNNVDLGWGDLYFYQRYYGYYTGRSAGGGGMTPASVARAVDAAGDARWRCRCSSAAASRRARRPRGSSVTRCSC